MPNPLVSDTAKLAADIWQLLYNHRDEIGVVSGVTGVLGISLPSVRRFLGGLVGHGHIATPTQVTTDENLRLVAPTTNQALDHTFPHNLPARQFFVGRQRERKQLAALIDECTPLILVIGPAGNGKTALLLEELHRQLAVCEQNATHQTQSRKAIAGIVYLSAKGVALKFNDLYEAVTKVTSEVRLRAVPSNLRIEALNDLLRARRFIVAIDNFETIGDKELTRFVVGLPEPSTAVVTTRFANFQQHYPSVTVSALPEDDGFSLIEQQAMRIGVSGFDQHHRRPTSQLYDATGGSPLAIKWALGQIRQRGETLIHVVDRLRSAKDDIFREMFDHSWRQLDGSSRNLLQAFLIFGSGVSRATLLASSTLSEDEFNHALGKLIELSLVETNFVENEISQTLSIHSLTRAFVSSEDRENGLRPCRARALAYFSTLVHDLRRTSVDTESLDELDAELDNIFRVLSDSVDEIRGGVLPGSTQAANAVVQLVSELSVYLWTRGLWDRRVLISELGIVAAKSVEAWHSAGRFAYYVGIVRIWQQRLNEASDWRLQSKQSYDRAGFTIESLLADRLAALIMMRQGQYDDAVKALTVILTKLLSAAPADREAVRLFADWYCSGPEGWQSGIVAIRQEIGIALNSKGDFGRALEWLQESLVLALTISDLEGGAVSHSHIGQAFLGLGDLENAEKHFAEGLSAAKATRRASTTYRCLQGLSHVQFRRGDRAGAAANAQFAVDGFRQLGMEAEQKDLNCCWKNMRLANGYRREYDHTCAVILRITLRLLYGRGSFIEEREYAFN